LNWDIQFKNPNEINTNTKVPNKVNMFNEQYGVHVPRGSVVDYFVI
jgi:hypothetical protein